MENFKTWDGISAPYMKAKTYSEKNTLHASEQLYTVLTSFDSLRVEWSLKIEPSRVQERDRITFWLNEDQLKCSENKSKMITILQILDTPSEVISKHINLLDKTVFLGIAISRIDISSSKCLYIHYKEDNTNRYVGYKWTNEDNFSTHKYSFYYFPCIPDGVYPEEFITSDLQPVFNLIAKSDYLKERSGFWLRNYKDSVDQVDLIFPWLPKMEKVYDAIKESGFCTENALNHLNSYRNLSFRHIAFSTDNRFTFYFSAPINSHAIRDFNLIKSQIDNKSKTLNSYFMSRYMVEQEKNSHSDFEQYVGQFYDSDDLYHWKKVLGDKMHYHFGIFDDQDHESDPFDKAISELYRFIPKGSSIYDIGSGWGGPAEQLTREQDCKTLSITNSKTQYAYCHKRNLNVRLGNAETTLPPYQFDTILFIESFEHILNKMSLLRRLRPFGKQLVMRVHCQDQSQNSTNFANTMHMISSLQLGELIEQSGWEIKHWRNRRCESIPSVDVWHHRFQTIPLTKDHHLETFRDFCSRVMKNKNAWADSNPLIELVAI